MPNIVTVARRDSIIILVRASWAITADAGFDAVRPFVRKWTACGPICANTSDRVCQFMQQGAAGSTLREVVHAHRDPTKTTRSATAGTGTLLALDADVLLVLSGAEVLNVLPALVAEAT